MKIYMVADLQKGAKHWYWADNKLYKRLSSAQKRKLDLEKQNPYSKGLTILTCDNWEVEE